MCSYPTYEEMETYWNGGVTGGVPNVLILPMRNGNPTATRSPNPNFSLVLILPMRNGNVEEIIAYLNEKAKSSYPTYEEWKPKEKIQHQMDYMRSSYPTYEEWKHSDLALLLQIHHSFLSYLWGMETFIHLFISSSSVLVPYPTYEEWKHYNTELENGTENLVLILPMRNGNGEDWKDATATFATFLSYLWGMETKIGPEY